MQKPAVERGWFSIQGAAYYTGFSLSSIEKALRLNLFKSRKVKIEGTHSRRIKREWLDAWIEEQDGGTAEPPEPLRLHPDDIEAIAAAVVKLLRSP